MWTHHIHWNYWIHYHIIRLFFTNKFRFFYWILIGEGKDVLQFLSPGSCYGARNDSTFSQEHQANCAYFSRHMAYNGVIVYDCHSIRILHVIEFTSAWKFLVYHRGPLILIYMVASNTTRNFHCVHLLQFFSTATCDGTCKKEAWLCGLTSC